MNAVCETCIALQAQLADERAQSKGLNAEVERLRAQLREVSNLCELQAADLDRYRKAYEDSRPNQRERVAVDQLQLALERVLADARERPESAALPDSRIDPDAEGTAVGKARQSTPRQARPHGRRRLDMENLPVREVIIDPEEVLAAGGVGYELVDVETSDRLAFQRAMYQRLRILRRTWKRIERVEVAPARAATMSCEVPVPSVREVLRLITAEIPKSLWPNFMADTSVIAATIVSKYDDLLPLHRQERISARNGFRVPRSTQCGWLGAAHGVLRRIVDAMFADAIAHSFCIATDSTGVPVLAKGGCKTRHMFVFVADRDHVLFRSASALTQDSVAKMLEGYRGHLLADAAPVYDILYTGGEIIEVACWFHLRRYFWRALETERALAIEALALIAKLFTIVRECLAISMPERTEVRAKAARPLLELFDAWIERNRTRVDPRGRLDKAITYYVNQRTALHRFLEDGRLRLDNSLSEQQLRRTILGTDNWTFFANREGLRWYSVFRSLLASCALHDLNPQTYLEEVLRLAPHWPANRVLELAPKYWAKTRERLDDQQRAILTPPWELERALELARAGPSKAAA